MSRAALARGLVGAEERLRAAGLTGARAFEALVLGLRARLGDEVTVDPVAAEAVADLSLAPGLDLLGLAYERFFPELFKGRRGQYFTPPPVVELLLARLGDLRGCEVLDPTCGSGGLLVAAHRAGATVRGIEVDPFLVELARLNLRLAGVEAPRVAGADFFTSVPEPVDVVIANPPFSVDVRDPAALAGSVLAGERGRVSSDALFMEHLARWVRPGGRAGVVLPWSVVTNPSLEPVRQLIDAGWTRRAVCALPEGVFRPFGGAAGRACLLWLHRVPPTQTAAMSWAVLDDPGYDTRSVALKTTSPREVDALSAGRGWIDLPPGAWTPAASVPRDAVSVGALATVREGSMGRSTHPAVDVAVVDLADTDKNTGEVTRAAVGSSAELRGAKVVMEAGDVLVSRLRPELGNVAIARRPPGVPDDLPLVGSTEWIVLHPADHPHTLLHLLRSPRWRDGLPVTGGQTRPRTSAEAVLDSPVRWPSEPQAARIERLSAELHRARAEARAQLEQLQALVDAWSAAELDSADLDAGLDALDAAGSRGASPAATTQ